MINVLSEGINHKAIDIGSLSSLPDYVFTHPRLQITVENKLFTGSSLGSTGAEVSFTELKPKTTITFLHKHRKHEEIYIFLKGYGQYQVDDVVFDVKEGTMVRVSPDGSRTLRNDSDITMLYMVIQSVAGTLAGFDVSDGYRVKGEITI